jgi:hypothetical protein
MGMVKGNRIDRVSNSIDNRKVGNSNKIHSIIKTLKAISNNKPVLILEIILVNKISINNNKHRDFLNKYMTNNNNPNKASILKVNYQANNRVQLINSITNTLNKYKKSLLKRIRWTIKLSSLFMIMKGNSIY